MTGPGLDPADDAAWDRVTRLGQLMVADMVTHLRGLRQGPTWRPMDAGIRAELARPLDDAPPGLEAAYQDFRRLVLPHGPGNAHPGFMGWAQGGGTVEGMLAELLAGGLNANAGGRDHAAIAVEGQVVAWLAKLLGLPPGTSGILLAGASTANMCAILVARTRACGTAARTDGIAGRNLAAYASEAAHGCIARAMDFAGLGTAALRLVRCTPDGRMDPAALEDAMDRDAAAGIAPLAVVGTAGSVATGACDDLEAIGARARSRGAWFHVDAAIGGAAAASPAAAPLLAGIGEADSVATDLHKWAQAPYDCGCLLVADAAAHRATFSHEAPYLARAGRGMAAGATWPCDLGPDLSRRFRALGAWFTIRAHGKDGIGRTVDTGIALARRICERATREPDLEAWPHAGLCIAGLRYAAAPAQALDGINEAIAADVQESGVAAPSTARLAGGTWLRAAILNHRTRECDVDAMVDAVLEHGRRRAAAAKRAVDASGDGILPSGR